MASSFVGKEGDALLRLLLTAAIPLQGLIDRTSPTHGFINRQALAILAADGYDVEANWLLSQIDAFCEGGDWADTGWKNVGHMYNPETGQGYRGWPSATQVLRTYWDLARRYRAERNDPQTAFYLGAAAHLVQDLCVPHHAAATPFRGHKAFESWAARYRHRFAVHQGGIYNLARTPEGWVMANADYARAHWSDCLSANLDRALLARAVGDLLPRAQRTTAGFVAYFFRRPPE
jgi:phospholipase C